MSDFSHHANMIVEAVQAAAWEVGETARVARDPKPTPFQRAVIGGLVLIAHALQVRVAIAADASGHDVSDFAWISDETQIDAAKALLPFIDPVP